MRWDGGPFLEAATIRGKRPRRQANQVPGYAGSALVTFDPYLRVDEPDMACALGAPAAPITSLRTATRGWVGVSLREGNHREVNWNGPFHVGTTHGMEATEAERLRAVVGLRATRPRVAVREVLEEGRARGEHLLVNDIVTRTRARGDVSTQISGEFVVNDRSDQPLPNTYALVRRHEEWAPWDSNPQPAETSRGALAAAKSGLRSLEGVLVACGL
jgi:hypothetical protein